MPKHALLDATVTVNGTALSTDVESVEISIEREDVDLTAMGATAREHYAGLRNDAITVNFYQNFDASRVDAILSPLLTNTSGFSVVIKPTSAATSTTNPSFTATCLLLSYQPLNGTVGNANQTSVSFVCNGAIVRGTT